MKRPRSYGSSIVWVITILVFMLIMAIVQRTVPAQQSLQGAEAIMALGLTLIAAYLMGRFVARFGLPKITGYLFAGILTGPYFVNLLSLQVVEQLRLIDNIALSFIALTAGGEFIITKVRRQKKLILNVLVWQSLIVLVGVAAIVTLIAPRVPYLSAFPLPVVLGIALLFGATALAKSPATTIAIITETGAKGRFTDMVLGITVAKDITVVLLFAFILAFAEPLIVPDGELHFDYLLLVLQDIFFSLFIGVVAGGIIYLYLRYVDRQIFIFLMGLILAVIEISAAFHLEIILIFMMAGFVVQNFSSLGEGLIKSIESYSLPIYVPFFAIAGASLNFEIFLQNWFFIIILVAGRLVMTYVGTRIGATRAGEDKVIKNFAWMGFVAQAGVTLGLAIIVERSFPGGVGTYIKTVLIGMIALNQVAGPIMFRYALGKSGEIPPGKRPV